MLEFISEYATHIRTQEHLYCMCMFLQLPLRQTPFVLLHRSSSTFTCNRKIQIIKMTETGEDGQDERS